tara:strand:- start:2730 stop:3527 length:798 start_codon:yes stop_codon:yes gene_type:complete
VDNRPIGVFDSGLGGLTVVKALKELLPNESIVYLGDTARLPYGVKSQSLVKQFSIQITKFLLEKNAKAIIIACNTATAMALNSLKNKFKDVPIIGVIEPGSDKGISETITKKIGVIGTIATISSGAYEKAIQQKDSRIEVVSKACPLFVPFVEEGLINGSAINEIAKHYLSSFNNRVDTLILGCTHYPLLKDIIFDNTEKINLIDSASTVADVAHKVLLDHRLLSSKNNLGAFDCYVTDLPMRFEELGNIFFGSDITNVQLVNEF